MRYYYIDGGLQRVVISDGRIVSREEGEIKEKRQSVFDLGVRH